MTALIAVDWGTSSFRAWRTDAEGRVLERRRAARGILTVPAGGWDEAVAELLGDWLAASDAPVLMCGMVGSRQGWIEAPYAAAPASLAELAAQLAPVPEQPRFRIVPGLSWRAEPSSAAELMRGEETQLLGLDRRVRLAVLPGTHSKWALLDSGRVRRFVTYMTGELFDLLAHRSILGRLMPEGSELDPAGFDRGLDDSAAEGFDIAGALFGVRSRGLLGDLAAGQLSGYLSGLLVGGEVRSALRRLAAEEAQATVAIVGSGPLAALYARALASAGRSTEAHDEDLALHGLLRLAAAAKLIPLGQPA